MDKSIFLAGFTVLFGTIFCACDSNDKDYKAYNSWDADGNYVIDGNEFSDTYSESDLLTVWDKDSNKRISREEFSIASYSIWDADKNGMIELNEWTAATNFYLTAGNYEKRGEFGYWDTDKDSLMRDTEFMAFSDSLRYFDEYDLDKDDELGRTEFSSLLFKIYDLDGDGVLRENEFSAFNNGKESLDEN